MYKRSLFNCEQSFVLHPKENNQRTNGWIMDKNKTAVKDAYTKFFMRKKRVFDAAFITKDVVGFCVL
jgi:hypothetical protein